MTSLLLLIFIEFIIRILSFFVNCSCFFIENPQIITLSAQQKNPGNLTVPGYLTFGHNVPCGTQFILYRPQCILDFASLHLGRAFAL